MTEQPRSTPRTPLTDTQCTRIEFARRDLEHARAEDLAQMEAASLILLVERLRNRLGDVIDVIDEVASTSQL